MENYVQVTEIANGAYGRVYKARDLNHNRLVALKKIAVINDEQGVPISTIREITSLRSLQSFGHRNIVRLYDIFANYTVDRRAMDLTLVFEHVEQDLQTYIRSCPSTGIDICKIKDIIHQILNAIDFLHSNRIVHRDLKPQNILINRQGVVKVADFGLAKVFCENAPITSVVVTLWYRCPEVLLQSTYATPVDMWSIGCIMAELYLREPLFCGQTDIDQLQKIFSMIGLPDESEWPVNISFSRSAFRQYRPVEFTEMMPEICEDGVDLLQKLLKFNPKERLTAEESLQHPYFQEILQDMLTSEKSDNHATVNGCQ